MSLNRELDNERRKQSRKLAKLKKDAEALALEALSHMHRGEYDRLYAKAYNEVYEEAIESGEIVE